MRARPSSCPRHPASPDPISELRQRPHGRGRAPRLPEGIRPGPGGAPPGPAARFRLRAVSRAAMLWPCRSDRLRRLPGDAWPRFRGASAPASLEPVFGTVGIRVVVSLPGRSAPASLQRTGGPRSGNRQHLPRNIGLSSVLLQYQSCGSVVALPACPLHIWTPPTSALRQRAPASAKVGSKRSHTLPTSSLRPGFAPSSRNAFA